MSISPSTMMNSRSVWNSDFSDYGVGVLKTDLSKTRIDYTNSKNLTSLKFVGTEYRRPWRSVYELNNVNP